MNLLVINSGSAHDYMLRRYAHLAGLPIEEAVLITLQLGGGCSAAAIRGGRSVDTSMGFTPLEGLMMGTRTGDLDPGLLLDPVRNAAATGVECRISRDAALVQAWVVPVDEAALMAEAADECLRLLGHLPNA